MWPRLFELLPKLIETLPHLDRFSSVADRLLTARAGEDASLNSSLETLRAEINHLDSTVARIDATHVAAHAVLTHKLDELSTEISTAEEAALASRSITVALGHSIVAIERQLRALRGLLISTLILLIVLALMIGWLVLIHSH